MAFQVDVGYRVNGPTPQNMADVKSQIERGINPRTSVKLDIDKASASQLAGRARSAVGNVNIPVNLNISGNSLKAVKDFGDSSSMRKLQRDLQDINKEFQQLGKAKTASHVHAMSESIEEFGQRSSVALKRFLAFTIATAGVIKVAQLFKQSFDEAVKYENTMTKIAQVTERPLAGVLTLRKETLATAKQFGTSANDIAEGALIIAQAGKPLSEVTKAMQAIAKANVSPTFGSAAESAEALVAVTSQFTQEAGKYEQILSRINFISAREAVESKDLVGAVQKAGGAFKLAGSNLNEFLSIITAVRSTTRESADEIATGLRTVVARIARPETIDFFRREFKVDIAPGDKVDDVVTAIEKIREALKETGDIPGLTGKQIIDPTTGELIDETTKKTVRFSRVLEELGGIRQQSRTIPLFTQFGKIKELINSFEEIDPSTGLKKSLQSLDNDSKTAQQSIQREIERTKQAFVSFGDEFINNPFSRFGIEQFLKMAQSIAEVGKELVKLQPLILAISAGPLLNFGRRFSGQFLPKIIDPTKHIQAKATGGPVFGSQPGDSVPCMLTPGEVVLNKHQQTNIGRILGKPAGDLFGAAGVPGFANGGVVFKEYKYGKKDARKFLIENLGDEEQQDKYLELHKSGKPFNVRDVYGKNGLRSKYRDNVSELAIRQQGQILGVNSDALDVEKATMYTSGVGGIYTPKTRSTSIILKDGINPIKSLNHENIHRLDHSLGAVFPDGIDLEDVKALKEVSGNHWSPDLRKKIDSSKDFLYRSKRLADRGNKKFINSYYQDYLESDTEMLAHSLQDVSDPASIQRGVTGDLPGKVYRRGMRNTIAKKLGLRQRPQFYANGGEIPQYSNGTQNVGMAARIAQRRSLLSSAGKYGSELPIDNVSRQNIDNGYESRNDFHSKNLLSVRKDMRHMKIDHPSLSRKDLILSRMHNLVRSRNSGIYGGGQTSSIQSEWDGETLKDYFSTDQDLRRNSINQGNRGRLPSLTAEQIDLVISGKVEDPKHNKLFRALGGKRGVFGPSNKLSSLSNDGRKGYLSSVTSDDFGYKIEPGAYRPPVLDRLKSNKNVFDNVSHIAYSRRAKNESFSSDKRQLSEIDHYELREKNEVIFPEVQRAVKRTTRDINSYIYDKDYHDENFSRKNTLEKRKNIQAMLNQSKLPANAITYSGLDRFSSQLAESVRPGGSFVLPRFLSSSFDKEEAMSFAVDSRRGADRPVVLKIRNYKGQKGIALSGEQEMFMPNNQQFKVLKVQDFDDHRELYVDRFARGGVVGKNKYANGGKVDNQSDIYKELGRLGKIYGIDPRTIVSGVAELDPQIIKDKEKSGNRAKDAFDTGSRTLYYVPGKTTKSSIEEEFIHAIDAGRDLASSVKGSLYHELASAHLPQFVKSLKSSGRSRSFLKTKNSKVALAESFANLVKGMTPEQKRNIGKGIDARGGYTGLFGKDVAEEAREYAKRGKLYAYDANEYYHKVNPDGSLDWKVVRPSRVPKSAKILSSQPYHKDVESGVIAGANIIKLTDPNVTKLDEIKTSGVARSSLLDPVIRRLDKKGVLTGKTLLDAINKRGSNQIVKTAFGDNNVQSLGVFGLRGLTEDDTNEIIRQYQAGEGSGFFTQNKVKRNKLDELRVHIAVGPDGEVSVIKGGTISKETGFAPTSKHTVKNLVDKGLKPDLASNVSGLYSRSAQSAAKKTVEDLVKQKGIKNAFFGVDVGATGLDDAIKAGITPSEFKFHKNAKSAIVYETNPSEFTGSSGYVSGSVLKNFVKGVFGENKPVKGKFPKRRKSKEFDPSSILGSAQPVDYSGVAELAKDDIDGQKRSYDRISQYLDTGTEMFGPKISKFRRAQKRFSNIIDASRNKLSDIGSRAPGLLDQLFYGKDSVGFTKSQKANLGKYKYVDVFGNFSLGISPGGKYGPEQAPSDKPDVGQDDSRAYRDWLRSRRQPDVWQKAPTGFEYNLGGCVKKFANGGPVPGSGHGDTVPALLSPGEVVLNKRQQRKVDQLTGSSAELFKAAGVPGFESGGIIGRVANTAKGIAGSPLGATIAFGALSQLQDMEGPLQGLVGTLGAFGTQIALLQTVVSQYGPISKYKEQLGDVNLQFDNSAAVMDRVGADLKGIIASRSALGKEIADVKGQRNKQAEIVAEKTRTGVVLSADTQKLQDLDALYNQKTQERAAKTKEFKAAASKEEFKNARATASESAKQQANLDKMIERQSKFNTRLMVTAAITGLVGAGLNKWGENQITAAKSLDRDELRAGKNKVMLGTALQYGGTGAALGGQLGGAYGSIGGAVIGTAAGAYIGANEGQSQISRKMDDKISELLDKSKQGAKIGPEIVGEYIKNIDAKYNINQGPKEISGFGFSNDNWQDLGATGNQGTTTRGAFDADKFITDKMKFDRQNYGFRSFVNKAYGIKGDISSDPRQTINNTSIGSEGGKYFKDDKRAAQYSTLLDQEVKKYINFATFNEQLGAAMLELADSSNIPVELIQERYKNKINDISSGTNKMAHEAIKAFDEMYNSIDTFVNSLNSNYERINRKSKVAVSLGQSARMQDIQLGKPSTREEFDNFKQDVGVITGGFGQAGKDVGNRFVNLTESQFKFKEKVAELQKDEKNAANFTDTMSKFINDDKSITENERKQLLFNLEKTTGSSNPNFNLNFTTAGDVAEKVYQEPAEIYKKAIEPMNKVTVGATNKFLELSETLSEMAEKGTALKRAFDIQNESIDLDVLAKKSTPIQALNLKQVNEAKRAEEATLGRTPEALAKQIRESDTKIAEGQAKLNGAGLDENARETVLKSIVAESQVRDRATKGLEFLAQNTQQLAISQQKLQDIENKRLVTRNIQETLAFGSPEENLSLRRDLQSVTSENMSRKQRRDVISRLDSLPEDFDLSVFTGVKETARSARERIGRQGVEQSGLFSKDRIEGSYGQSKEFKDEAANAKALVEQQRTASQQLGGITLDRAANTFKVAVDEFRKSFIGGPQLPVEPPKFASGGIVPGVGSRDTVPAMLTPGEMILNKKQQKELGISPSMLNVSGDGFHFAGGGIVRPNFIKKQEKLDEEVNKAIYKSLNGVQGIRGANSKYEIRHPQYLEKGQPDYYSVGNSVVGRRELAPFYGYTDKSKPNLSSFRKSRTNTGKPLDVNAELDQRKSVYVPKTPVFRGYAQSEQQELYRGGIRGPKTTKPGPLSYVAPAKKERTNGAKFIGGNSSVPVFKGYEKKSNSIAPENGEDRESLDRAYQDVFNRRKEETRLKKLSDDESLSDMMPRTLKFNYGGVVPGLGNEDNQPAILTPGEVVINQKQQRKIDELMGSSGRLFKEAGVPGFNNGGIVGGKSGMVAGSGLADAGAGIIKEFEKFFKEFRPENMVVRAEKVVLDGESGVKKIEGLVKLEGKMDMNININAPGFEQMGEALKKDIMSRINTEVVNILKQNGVPVDRPVF